MSLVETMANVANGLIGPGRLAGFDVVFTRVEQQPFDPITGQAAPDVPTTWSGRGTWTQNLRHAPTIELTDTGLRVTTKTMLVSGLSVANAPRAGDTIVGGGVQSICGPVTFVGDADGGVVPLYRVTVTS